MFSQPYEFFVASAHRNHLATTAVYRFPMCRSVTISPLPVQRHYLGGVQVPFITLLRCAQCLWLACVRKTVDTLASQVNWHTRALVVKTSVYDNSRMLQSLMLKSPLTV